jgi:hypothetical protein
MLSMLMIVQILFAHWVSDFVLQTHWMATNKSKNWLALGSHVLTYTAALGFLMMTLSLVMSNLAIAYDLPNSVIFEMTPYAFALWVAVNGVLHFVTDAVTSRITSKLWAKGDAHNFFVVIGLDQMIHYLCLFGTMILLIN